MERPRQATTSSRFRILIGLFVIVLTIVSIVSVIRTQRQSPADDTTRSAIANPDVTSDDAQPISVSVTGTVTKVSSDELTIDADGVTWRFTLGDSVTVSELLLKDGVVVFEDRDRSAITNDQLVTVTFARGEATLPIPALTVIVVRALSVDDATGTKDTE